MPIIETAQLFNDIKTYNLKSFYFFLGKESFMIEEAVKRIVVKVLAGKNDEFNFQKFDGNDFSIVDFSNAVEAMPFLIPQKVIILNDINLEKLSESDFNKLKQAVSDMPIQTTVIITSKSFEVVINKPKRKPDKNSIKTNKFISAILETCDIVEFGASEKATLSKFIIGHLAKNNLKISPSVANALIERCTNNYHIILNELEKIENYLDSGEVTLDIINNITVENVEENIFNLAKNILQKNAQKAFEILDNLFYQKTSPIIIIATLNMAFIDLYRAKCGTLANVSYMEVAKHFKYKGREFIMQNAFNDARKLSLTQIKICLKHLIEADEKLKSVKVNERILIEQMVTNIIASL
jgi:DNA polymerase-3 subunit delta